MSGARLSGGIIAAGEGSRLRRAGWTVPKPLVPVCGKPLLGHVIDNFLASAITSITIIVSETGRESARWTRAHYPNLDLRFIVRTTPSSVHSFLAVREAMPPGPGLISTVDALCRPAEFTAMVARARGFPEGAIVLAVTRYVDDERPLWVRLGAGGRITAIGGDGGDAVTAGLYLTPGPITLLPPAGELNRLRDLLIWWSAQGAPLYAVEVPLVIDVDRAEDVNNAARLIGDPAGRRSETETETK